MSLCSEEVECVYIQIVYELGALGAEKLLACVRTAVNQYVSERFTAIPDEIPTEEVDESVGLGSITHPEITQISLDVQKAMSEAERRKAEALNLLRHMETIR